MASSNEPDNSRDPASETHRAVDIAAFLVIERGETRKTVRPVETPVYVIGTAPDCDMVLGDPQFSNHHCYLYVQEGIVTLRQLPPSPETTVNGRVVRWGELRHLDRIRFGPYQLQLRLRPRWKSTSPQRPDKQPGQQINDALLHQDVFWDASAKTWPPASMMHPGPAPRLPQRDRFMRYWK